MTKAELLDLHSRLAQLEDLLARQTEPSNWSASGIDSIHELQEIIENL